MTRTSDSTHLRLPLTVRAAAFLFLFLGVSFGASVPFVLAHLDRHGELPMTFWFRSMAGPFEQLGPEAFFALGWTFVGVDPSAPMLALAESTLGLAMDRVELVTGYIDDAPAGPFDAATCLLTLHFLDAAERRRTNAEVHRRLRPGAPYVTVHCSFDQSPVGRALWLDRFAAQAVAAGADPDLAAYAREAVAQNSNLFDPETDERLLGEAGFADTSLFFTALTWRGWVSHA